MTIAQQVAHDFLESIEKMITANKLDVGVLDKKISYQSCEEAMMSVTDTKTGSVIATMRLNLNTNKLKREMQVKVLKEATKIYYPDAMKDVLPLKEFVKNITDKGYKVELTKDNVVSDTAVNIYKEVEIKE